LTAYIITYDLGKPEHDYSELREAIRGYNIYCQLQETAWLIVSANTPMEIRDNLKRHIDSNDKLFVSEIRAPAAWIGDYETGTSDWLHKFL